MGLRLVRSSVAYACLCVSMAVWGGTGCDGTIMGSPRPEPKPHQDGGGDDPERDSGVMDAAAHDAESDADSSPVDDASATDGGGGEENDAGSCGDSVRGSAEGCDDGNHDSGDGCDADCRPEMGWTCAPIGKTKKDACKPTCGDKRVVGGEACDDGNTVDGDYCTNDCKHAHSCGDGSKQDAAGESCDDGNTVSESCAYGSQSCSVCDASCHTAAGATSYCGDSTIDSEHGESCDDGDMAAGDGCDASCHVEAVVTCGNGVLDGGEECDDHNMSNLDGCNGACKKELGWNCNTVGAACTSVCGDGRKVGTEACDDGNTTTEACAYGQASCTVCNASCQNQAGAVSRCGDGIVQAANGEECDAANDQRCVACDIVCDTVFITYSGTGSFQITDTTFGAGDGTFPQTGGKIIVALPAGPTGPVAGTAGVVYLYSPVKATKTISLISTTVKTDLVGTAGTPTNTCLLNTGTLNTTTRELAWGACPYLGSHGTANWTPAQQNVSAGQGPGCVVYNSQGKINCSGSNCGQTGLMSGDNNVNDTWDQPMATYEFGAGYTTVKGRAKGAPGDGPGDKIEIPNTTTGRTWVNFDATETSRTCGFKPSNCPTPGAK